MEISPTHFAGSVVDRGNKSELTRFHTKLEGRTTEDTKDQIKELLHKQGLLNFSDEVSLAVQATKSTLVPQNVFGESNAEDIFKLCFGETDLTIDYNRFHEQGLVNVYAQHDWIKSFFVIRFPKIIIQHENTHVMRGIFNGSTFKPQVHLVPMAEHFSLLVSSKNKLDFYAVFDAKNTDDMLYHTSFVLQQKELNTLPFSVHWHGQADDQPSASAFTLSLEKLVGQSKLDLHVQHKRTHQLLCV
jgi:hypothetical protein